MNGTEKEGIINHCKNLAEKDSLEQIIPRSRSGFHGKFEGFVWLSHQSINLWFSFHTLQDTKRDRFEIMLANSNFEDELSHIINIRRQSFVTANQTSTWQR